MKGKKIVALNLVAALGLSIFTGCGFSVGNFTFGTDSEIKKQKELFNGDEIEEKAQLDDDAYYVLRDGEYLPLYFGNSSFAEGEKTTQPSTDRLLWYTDDGSKDADINEIPVLYKDDKLVYRYSDTLEEEFNFERFYDLGRSFGIYGLEKTKSGRYSLTIDDDLMYPDSDVYGDISTLTSETVIIEQMETMKLRVGQGLVSDYGTIINFAFDEAGNVIPAKPSDEYRFLVYSGTYKNMFTFKPTYRILGSAEDYVSYDFSFIDDDVIDITIPTWFESGYYLINGIGVIKYINAPKAEVSKEDLKNMDFNVPTNTEGLEGNYNVLGPSEEEELGDIPDIYGDHSEEILNSLRKNEDGNYEITVNDPGEYNITIKLSMAIVEGMERETPSCEMTTSFGDTYYFKYDEESQSLVTSSIYLPSGKSVFTFGEMNQITPTFEIEKSGE